MPSWKRSGPAQVVQTAQLAERRRWLLLVDECGVGAGLADWLRQQGQQVVTVTPGSAFARRGADAYLVRPAARDDYEALLQSLQHQDRLPDEVVHLWMVDPPAASDDTSEVAVNQILERGFYSLLALTQALGEQTLEACRISIVSTGLQEVTGSEELVAAKATVIGPCKVIPQEYPSLTSRSIDLVLPPSGRADAHLLQPLIGELTADRPDDLVALRGRHRWVQTYEPLPLPPLAGPPTRLRQRGVYLITGGLGGLGLALAAHLVRSVQARLVLLGRTPLPPRAQWPALLAAPDTAPHVRRRIEQVQALEAQGAEVLLVTADVADPAQVRAAVAQAQAHFGALHGVFHTAGVPGVGLLQLKAPSAAAAVLAPKVQGTLALHAALRDQPLDCVVLFSSITSATSGGPGQVDYCAANAFLDAFARRQRGPHGLTVAVSWGEWQWDAWQDGLQGFSEEVRNFLISNRQRNGISFADGMDALDRILSSTLSHVFVTTQDLSAMVEMGKNFSAQTIAQQHQQQLAETLYPRPELATSYVAPRNDLERQIATVWQRILGIEQIGIDDNFFDLGGNSLLGISLVTQLRKALKLDQLPSYVLYDAPSIRALAEHVSQPEEPDLEDEDFEDRDDKRKAQLDYLQRRAQMGAV